MTKKSIASLLIALAFVCIPAHAEKKGQFGASAAYQFDNHSFMVQGRYVKQISNITYIAPAISYDFDLEELVLDVDFHIKNPGTRYYGIGGINYGDSEAGMNIGMGMHFNYSEKIKGFSEIKYIFIGWSGAVLNAGFYF